MDRRDFIRLAGGGVVLAALPACAGAADARAAWREPGAGEADVRRKALSWAILAPNPHNMQPWLADLSEPGVMTLYVDPARRLPVTDPFDRQIVIGCGAFLELLRMAAAQDGLAAGVVVFDTRPRLGGGPVAKVRFSPGAAPDPLFAHVPIRRTNRNPFEARAVPEGAAQVIAAAAAHPLVQTGVTVDPARTAAIGALAFEGARVEAHTPAAHRESVDRTFIGSRDVAAHRYGVSIEGAAVDALNAVGLLTQEKMKREGTFAFGQSLEYLRKGADTARGFLWQATKGESRAEEAAAGAAYLRANLAAAGLGVAMHPWSQCLQEYGAQDAVREKVHAALAPDGGRVQMLARIGYAKAVQPAPRRGLAANIRTA